MTVRRPRVIFVLLSVVFRGMLDVSYGLWISPYYSYMGLTFDQKPTMLIVFSYMLVFVTSLIVPIITTRPSKFIAGYLYLATYIPITSLMALTEFPMEPALWLTLVYVFLFCLSRQNLKINFLRVPFAKRGTALFLLLLGFFLIVQVVLGSKFGIRLPRGIYDVYELRSEFTDALATGGPGFGYIYMWQGSVIIPFIMAWALMRRKMFIFSIAVVSQVMTFAMSGMKSHLFGILFVIWILAGIRLNKDKLVHYVLYSFIVLIGIGGAMEFLLNIKGVNILFVRRIFFMPALLYYYYYDFFSQNYHTFLSQSAPFRWFLEYPYALGIPNLIGDVYFSNPETHANANMWADAFASFGVAGMFLFAMPLWILMNIIDNVSRGKNIYLVYALIIMPVRTLTDTSLLVALMTHGLLLAIILLMMLPKNREGDRSFPCAE